MYYYRHGDDMHLHLHFNGLALLVSVVASFALGALWYGPLFAKVWQRAMGFADAKPSGAEIAKGSVLNLIGTFLTVFAMAHIVALWRPSTWRAGDDMPPWVYGGFSGFVVWFGFIVPVLLNGVAFERKSWKVFFIGAGFQFLSLQLIGMILAYWR